MPREHKKNSAYVQLHGSVSRFRGTTLLRHRLVLTFADPHFILIEPPGVRYNETKL